jgi:hypothetical protein
MTEDYRAGVFFISPIGDQDSRSRSRSDVIARAICEPLASSIGLSCVRADHITEPGLIIKQVVGHLLSSAFVVADLAGGNPNVMYEMAVRHTTGRPCLCLGRPGERVPYDIAPLRVFPVDDADQVSLEQARKTLIASARQINNSGVGPHSPLSEPLGTWRLRADLFAFSLDDFDSVFEEYGALRTLVAQSSESLRAGTVPRSFMDDLLRQLDYMEGTLERLRVKSGLPSLESYTKSAVRRIGGLH